jgi:hypothetical protein
MFELCVALVAGVWIETTPQDFMDGWYDPLLYVSRRLQKEGANPADSGAVEFYARFDANRDGYYDLISADNSGPLVRLWFGGPTGYQSSNVRYFPVTYGGNCDMADLNLDGWPELIHSGYNSGECRIYWGSQAAGGPDPNNYTSLPNGKGEAVFVYDLDRDTYLDVIIAGNFSYTLMVYWGGPGGYSSGNVSTRAFGSYLAHNLEVVDLDKDGYTDIILIAHLETPPKIYILWGDGDRNLNNNQLWSDNIQDYYPHGLTVADLNRDGWLDIVLSGEDDVRTARVYWSDNGRFSSANKTVINTNQCYGGSSAWDVNGDGWLDLVFFRGGGFYLPLLFCLNSRTPPYFRDNDTVKFGLSARHTGGFTYDFNRDGKMDVFANAYGDYSYVYWGVRSTGSYDSVQSLPVRDDHHGGFRECGNVYDRSPTAWYESGVFSSTDLQATATISWIAWDSTQVGSEVRMYIRTRRDGSSPWSNWRQVFNGETVFESPYFPARDIQYRAEFRWQNPAWLPWLERVNLETGALYEDEEGKGEQLRFGSGKGLVWVSWPNHKAEVYLYSPDGRRAGQASLQKDKVEFRGLNPGVYYLMITGAECSVKEKVLVR